MMVEERYTFKKKNCKRHRIKFLLIQGKCTDIQNIPLVCDKLDKLKP
jgi:hypothetical protein